MKPEFVKDRWEENDIWMKANLIAYNQIREVEEAESRII